MSAEQRSRISAFAFAPDARALGFGRRIALDPTLGLAALLALYVLGVGLMVAAVIEPPLTDFPNHLARLWMLGGGLQSPLSRFYAAAWNRASTNIGADLFVVGLAYLMPTLVAAKLLAILTLIGPPLAAARLNGAVFSRASWWQLVFLCLTWTTTALWGFMSYQLGITLALLAASLEPQLEARPRLANPARLVLSALVLICHPFGLLFYAALLAGLAIGPNTRRLHPSALPSLAADLVGRGLVVIAAVAVLYLLAPTPPGAHAGNRLFVWALSPKAVLAAWLSPFLSYNLLVDLAFLAPIAGVVLWLIGRAGFQMHLGLLLAGVGLLVLAAAMPVAVGDAWWLNRRVPLMAVLTLGAAVLPSARIGGRERAMLASGLVALVLLRSLWIAEVWRERNQDIRSVEQVLSALPRGAPLLSLQAHPVNWRRSPVGRYLAGTSGNAPEPTLRHLGALAVLEHGAFIPTLFTVPGQQPLRVRAPYDQSAVQSSLIPDLHALDRSPTAEVLHSDPYLADWRRRFNYVLLLGLDEMETGGAVRIPSDLVPVAQNRYAALLRRR